MADNSAADLCDVCQKIDFTKNETLSLGSLASLMKKTSCPFCMLVMTTCQRTWVEGNFGVQLHDSRASEQEIGSCVLQRAYNKRFEVWIITGHLPLGEGPSRPLIFPLYAIGSASNTPGSFPFRPAHELTPFINIALIKSWIDDCLNNHSGCSNVSIDKPKALDGRFRLIDVQRQCLVTSPCHTRYIALSYVWGPIPQLCATKDNLDALYTPGAFSNGTVNIAQIIRSAMDFVEAIGEQYLWVDALCIVQDDQTDKEHQISNMHFVYNAALLAIVAAASESSTSALPGLQDSARRKSQFIRDVKGFRLTVGPPELSDTVKRSKWHTRGWCFQEYMLSRRLVYFFEDQVYFECLDSWRCEMWDENDQTTTKTLLDIYKAVEEYTTRQLSAESDRWNAFAAYSFSSAVADCSESALRHGIELRHFPRNLMWESVKCAIRRDCTMRSLGREWTFPSWSWTGWLGDIDYMHANVDKSRLAALYDRNEVAGVYFSSGELQRGQLDLMCNILHLETSIACFKISHRDAIAIPNEYGWYRSDTSICWKVSDASSNFCGVAKGLDIWRSKDDAPSSEYWCILLSRSVQPVAALDELSYNYPRRPRPLTITCKEDVERYADLPYDSTDWPKGDTTLSLPKFENRPWAYLNFLVVREVPLSDYYERVGLAQIHEDVWLAAHPRYDTFKIV